jgi:hypothetical protein
MRNLVVVLIVLVICGCHSQKEVQPQPALNTWMIGNNTYSKLMDTITTDSLINYTFTTADYGGGYLRLSFKDTPVSRQYRIAAAVRSDTEVQISAWNPTMLTNSMDGTSKYMVVTGTPGNLNFAVHGVSTMQVTTVLSGDVMMYINVSQ